MPKEKITVDSAMADFKAAYDSKRSLVEREKQDHLFALGKQWSADDESKLREFGFKPFTDNRIAPNIFLLTGLERQNRTDFKAFPEGDEDGLKSDIATALCKDAIKKSGFQYKSSEQFKDGITCGESHLELYLDYTDDLLNGKPCWRKFDGDSIFADPASREYDFSDARYVYKLTLGLDRGDLINLYPKARKKIEAAQGGKVNLSLIGNDDKHLQLKDYPKEGSATGLDPDKDCFDVIERYYKKWVDRYFVGDYKTGEIRESEDREKAEAFIANYKSQIENDRAAYQQTIEQAVAAHVSTMPPEAQVLPIEQHLEMINQSGQLPPPPPEQDPERFIVIRRMVPEIWCFALTPGVDEPLSDDKAWFYPLWKGYPFVPYFARFSTAPLTGEDKHLLVQGVVHGVKGAQEKHNQAEMLMLRHLNSSANSGWLSEEDSWVDKDAVRKFGTRPGVDLEHKKGTPAPQRIFPNALSQGHAQISADSAEAIKAQLGINADLLATQQGSSQSGRAIALRQRQGLLMVQELFDNLSRTRQIAGKFLLSQLGKIYDTESAQKVLGEGFMRKSFPPVMLANEQTGQPEPMLDEETGEPMKFDKKMAELAIAEVLSGQLEKYDVAVGESVASETVKMANSAELLELSARLPIPPDILVRHTQLPETTKNEILASIQQAQAQAQALQAPPGAGVAGLEGAAEALGA